MQKMILAAAVSAAILSSVGLVHADNYDKKTTITITGTILIPGRSLPPGKYVMKLATLGADRHIVQIMNANETKIEATILAFNNERLTPTGKTAISYWETPAGTPPALRAWFYPGDSFGQEFAYPKSAADRISRQNHNAKVPSYPDSAGEGLDANKAAKLDVQDTPSSLNAAASSDNSASQSASQPQTVAQNTTEAPVQAAASAASNRNTTSADPTLLAQNAAPTQANTQTPTELPRTGSDLPTVFAFGLAAMLLAFALRFSKA